MDELRKYAIKGLEKYTGSDDIDIQLRYLVLFGYGLSVFGSSAGKEKKSIEELLETKLSKKSSELLDEMAKLLGHAKHEDVYKYQADVVRKLKNVVKKDKTLLVIVGSSPDKLGAVMEYVGYDVMYVSYSREWMYGNKLTTKKKNEFKKEIVDPIKTRLLEGGKTEAAVVDYVDSGNSMLLFMGFVENMDDELYDMIYPVLITQYSGKSEESIGTQISKLKRNAKVIETDYSYFVFSKASRCVEMLASDGKRALNELDITLCNVGRLISAKKIVPKVIRSISKWK